MIDAQFETRNGNAGRALTISQERNGLVCSRQPSDCPLDSISILCRDINLTQTINVALIRLEIVLFRLVYNLIIQQP